MSGIKSSTFCPTSPDAEMLFSQHQRAQMQFCFFFRTLRAIKGKKGHVLSSGPPSYWCYGSEVEERLAICCWCCHPVLHYCFQAPRPPITASSTKQGWRVTAAGIKLLLYGRQDWWLPRQPVDGNHLTGGAAGDSGGASDSRWIPHLELFIFFYIFKNNWCHCLNKIRAGFVASCVRPPSLSSSAHLSQASCKGINDSL